MLEGNSGKMLNICVIKFPFFVHNDTAGKTIARAIVLNFSHSVHTIREKLDKLGLIPIPVSERDHTWLVYGCRVILCVFSSFFFAYIVSSLQVGESIC